MLPNLRDLRIVEVVHLDMQVAERQSEGVPYRG